MSAPTLDTTANPVEDTDEFTLDIRVFESGTGIDEVIRMTDDGCGSTCQSACTSC